jgi:hypothetical protein
MEDYTLYTVVEFRENDPQPYENKTFEGWDNAINCYEEKLEELDTLVRGGYVTLHRADEMPSHKNCIAVAVFHRWAANKEGEVRVYMVKRL